ncbi:sodium channel protein Nach-like isoform X2 [Cimex lectularius]|uniref:Sodium channel protein Nach n=1 Tax=Cimex lectularius TaxID=79782 RepID=A0A8I6TJZ5_CIMLE|nr:sodium channel protein Nach-like isoform X2 [Cimex lectularius]
MNCVTHFNEMPDEMRKQPYKKHQLLETSLKHQTTEFFANSTLHGVRFIAEKGRPAYERLMWFIFVAIGAIVTLIIIVSLWDKFQTNPTITGLDTDFHNWDVPFPGISLCPTNPVSRERVAELAKAKWGESASEEKLHLYESFIKTVGNFSYRNFPEIVGYKDKADLDQGGFRQLLYKIVYPCEELMFDCEWKGEPIGCCDVFKPTFTENGFCYSFNTKNAEIDWPGRPEGIEPNEKFKVKEIYETDSKWSLMFNAENISSVISYNIYIHDSEELPSAEMAPQHIWVKTTNKIYFAARMTYTTNDTRQLTAKQRKCIFKDEVNLRTYPEYSYWACMTDCRMRYSMEKCSCVPFFYHKVDGFPYCKLDGLICLSQHIETMKKGLNCPCELGCDNTVYEVEKLNDAQMGEEDELEIGFVSWPMIRYKREVLFGWVDLLVSFGGIAGLFLGFSLLSGVEIVYYFTLRAACMVYRDGERLSMLRAEEAEMPKPEIDLSLKPKWGKDKARQDEKFVAKVMNGARSRGKVAPKEHRTSIPFLN